VRRRFKKLCAFDHEFEAQGFSVIAGVDEAGRGALAGPVVCAAVVLRDESLLIRVNDSKTVEEDERALRLPLRLAPQLGLFSAKPLG
jgi:ribonuclease HII